MKFEAKERPGVPERERDDSAEWVNVCWTEDAEGEPRVLFWFDWESGFGEYEVQGRLLICPASKPSFHERKGKTLGPLQVRFRGEVPEQARNAATVRAIAYEILQDWEGIEDQNGDPLPYTPEAGITALQDYRLLDAVSFAAGTLELHRQESWDKDKEDLGNV